MWKSDSDEFRGPGRVAVDGATGLEKVKVSISDKHVREARRLGRGNVSMGLRRMLAERDELLFGAGTCDD